MADQLGDPTVPEEMEGHEIKALKDAKKIGVWYKLSLSGGEDIPPRLGHSFITTSGVNVKVNEEDTEPLSTFPSSEDVRVMLIGGGNHEGATAEVWELRLSGSGSLSSSSSNVNPTNTKTGAVTQLPPIEGLLPKYEFLCSNISSKTWIFGGADAQLTFNDVGYIEDGMWVESLNNSTVGGGKNTKIPSPRTQGSNSSTVVVDGKSYLCVFAGGQAGVDAVPDGNLYLYDIEEQVWIVVPVQGDTPPTTQGHCLTAFGSKVYIHGGLNGSSLHESLYMIDVAGGVQNTPPFPCSWMRIGENDQDPSPPGRAAHGIAKIGDEEEKFYIFGGLGQPGSLNDLWEFDGVSKSWKNLTGKNSPGQSLQVPQPSPRFGAAMTSIGVKGPDSVSRYLLVHGGMNSEGDIFNDLWVYRV